MIFIVFCNVKFGTQITFFKGNIIMKLNDTTKKVIVLGVLSGMRANAGLICTALLIRKQPGIYFSPSRLVKFFSDKKALAALSVSGAAETVIDKLPTTPDRIEHAGLSARVASGAICGAAISKTAGRKPVPGMVIGGVAALASTFAFFYLRKSLCKALNVSDPFIGAAEDALAVAFGRSLLKKGKIS